MLDFDRGDKAEYLLAKQPGLTGVITWLDLQEAEREHIRRLRDRGFSLVNKVAGGNGLPPDERFFRGDNEVPAAQGLGMGNGESTIRWSPLVLTRGAGETSPLIDTGIRLSDAFGEWDIRIAPSEGPMIIAMAPGRETWHRDVNRSRTISVGVLRDAYSRLHQDRSFVADIEPYVEADDLGRDFNLTYWWPTVGPIGHRGGSSIPTSALRALTSHDVRNRTIPADLAEAGLAVDETFQKGGHLNPVVRLVDGNGSRIYVKLEENRRAVRAEVLASLIWYRLGWPGIADRSVLTEDGSVLVSTPVGGLGISDKKGFDEYFAPPFYSKENRSSLKTTWPHVLIRVTLDDLILADENDVVRFLTTNAAWGNTDRHSGNLKYGWRDDPDSIRGGYGYLLPVDHGKCFLNNGYSAAQDTISGSPADAVTGRIGNPHQLLRPFSELARADRAGTIATVQDWCQRLLTILRDIQEDSNWADWRVEVSDMVARVESIRSDTGDFVDECTRVVIA